MKTTITFPNHDPLPAEILENGTVAIHRPLGEKKDWVLTHVPTLNILGRTKHKKTARAYQKRLEEKIGEPTEIMQICWEMVSAE